MMYKPVPYYLMKLAKNKSDFKRSKEVDNVNNPKHYNSKGIECIDAIEASMSDIEFKGYLKGNIEKYIWRYTYKGKASEDLKKAEYYLKKLRERVDTHPKT